MHYSIRPKHICLLDNKRINSIAVNIFPVGRDDKHLEIKTFCRKAKGNLVQPKRLHMIFGGLKGPFVHLCGLKAAHVLLVII